MVDGLNYGDDELKARASAAHARLLSWSKVKTKKHPKDSKTCSECGDDPQRWQQAEAYKGVTPPPGCPPQRCRQFFCENNGFSYPVVGLQFSFCFGQAFFQGGQF